jgi:dehydrogenase/reductase SDR family member 12
MPSPAALLDRTLDVTVAPGFSRLGYLARAPTWDALPRLDGRTVLVTGATSGIGRAAAERFAALGARVLVAARSRERGTRTVAEIAAATGNDDVALVEVDLSDLASVRAAAERLHATEDALHVLVHNAGVMEDARRASADGVELTLATNVLGPFLLTELVADLLAAGAPSRIVTVSSGGLYAAALDLDDLQTERRDYDGTRVYARTKRAQVVLTYEWAVRLAHRGVVAHAMHPGWVDTPGLERSLPGFRRLTRPLLRTAAQGADTIVWLGAAEEPGGTTGGFWHDRRRRPEHRLPTTRGAPNDGPGLWTALERLSR